MPHILILCHNLQSFFYLPEVRPIELWDQINPFQYDERYSPPWCQHTQYIIDIIGKVTTELIRVNCEVHFVLNTKEYRMM